MMMSSRIATLFLRAVLLRSTDRNVLVRPVKLVSTNSTPTVANGLALQDFDLSECCGPEGTGRDGFLAGG